jgi:hypothetical protein
VFNNRRCDADPEVLSKYVLALVQNDPQKPGLQDTCVSKLEEFLGDGGCCLLEERGSKA